MCIEDLARRCLDSVCLDSYSLATYTTELIPGYAGHTALVGFIGALALIQTKSTSFNKTLGLMQPQYALTSDNPAYIREMIAVTNAPDTVFSEPDATRNGLFDVVSPFLKAGVLEPRGSIT